MKYRSYNNRSSEQTMAAVLKHGGENVDLLEDVNLSMLLPELKPVKGPTCTRLISLWDFSRGLN